MAPCATTVILKEASVIQWVMLSSPLEDVQVSKDDDGNAEAGAGLDRTGDGDGGSD